MSALTSWFLSDWQLGLCYSGWTAARSGDCSEVGLCFDLMSMEYIGSVKGTNEKYVNIFQIYN